MNQLSQFLYLTTIRWKSGKQHKIEIWFVEYNKRYYVISERRKHAHWVQNIVHNPKVSFTVGYETFEDNARVIDPDKESNSAAEVFQVDEYKIQLG